MSIELTALAEFHAFFENRAPIVVYGAGEFAEIFLQYNRACAQPLQILCCAVEDARANPQTVLGVAVRQVSDLTDAEKTAAALICVGAKFHGQITTILEAAGFETIVRLSTPLECRIREDYCTTRLRPVLPDAGYRFAVSLHDGMKLNIDDRTAPQGVFWKFRMSRQAERISVLEALLRGKSLWEAYQSHYGGHPVLLLVTENIPVAPDAKPLHEQLAIFTAVNLADQRGTDHTVTGGGLDKILHTVQTGAALTDRRIAEFADDTGDNISALNPWFSEVCALYWAWKNAPDVPFVGLCHYRRRFVLDAHALAGLVNGETDLVVAMPELILPDNRTVFTESFLLENDWEIMLAVIRRETPAYYTAALSHSRSVFLHPCNMLIARRAVFARYCAWLFTVTMKIMEECESRGIVHTNRYLGYLSENLLSIFVLAHAGDTRIACADTDFVS
ncbi:MAG: DUF4422 domain-containing protein [Oscillospiraceae bacterium]